LDHGDPGDHQGGAGELHAAERLIEPEVGVGEERGRQRLQRRDDPG
jgi:hypothetical protein